MKGLKITLRVLLVAALMAATMPYHHPADLHRDGSIDLRDAIMAMHEVASGAKDPASLQNHFRTAVTAIEVAANLKTVIKADATGDLAAPSSSLPIGLLAYMPSPPPVLIQQHLRAASTAFCPLDPSPPTPPPKIA
ncbi:MAG: hypothetical protein ABIL58_11375 [Pseudomonadota bacterium]